MFRKYLAEQCLARRNDAKRFVSIGAGNCDLEIDLGLHLRTAGYDDFIIDCLDLNTDMLERGRTAAAKAGVAAHVNFVQADFNAWTPAHQYDAVIANQSLHHVLELEDLFAQIKSSLKPHGSLVVSDMIGRNGHQRWPEALEIVHQFWRQLPPSYRLNRKLQRYEELYQDWDCSLEGFEGIRSQDILPLLLEYFQFRLFIGFGNVIDPFVDRAFGFNFDAAQAWDRSFIDRVHQRDQEAIVSGRIGPTHIPRRASWKLPGEDFRPLFRIICNSRPTARSGILRKSPCRCGRPIRLESRADSLLRQQGRGGLHLHL